MHFGSKLENLHLLSPGGGGVEIIFGRKSETPLSRGVEQLSQLLRDSWEINRREGEISEF